MGISSATLSATLIDELVNQGVTDVVISPGSRSTPLALACINDSRLVCHVRVDERSAAFLAVGIGRGNLILGNTKPALVISTSGTAAANHRPAIHEADNAGIPLIIISADRPEELHGIGDNQTMPQTNLHQNYVRASFNIHDRGEGKEAGTSIRSTAVQAVVHATGRGGSAPGPVHINVHLREPLTDALWEPQPLDGISPIVHAPNRVPGEVLYELVGLFSAINQVLVVAGDGTHPYDQRHLIEHCERLGWPIIAEPTSGVKYGGTLIKSGPWLASNQDFINQATPEVVVVLGRPTLSRDVTALIGRAREVIQFDPEARGWNPSRRATHLVFSPISELLPDVENESDRSWLSRWQIADARAMEAVDIAVSTDHGAVTAVRELVRDLIENPEPHLLVLGSSSPIRIVNETVPVLPNLSVIANRGVSGIDGFTSTAIGAALATGRRTLAITGDLSFLHDIPGLINNAAPGEPIPDLTIVVINNDGGAIFDRLGHLKAVDQSVFRRVFTTPHGHSPAKIARSMGYESVRIQNAEQVAATVANIPPKPGIRVVEFASDPEETRMTYASISMAIAEMFAPEEPYPGFTNPQKSTW
ncbi:2-succinyl-5-enolpyruvyl-6-hydroxy-3-cyclohexene-1-carboxylic-acid synthase [Stomatohabitans albus]|uniref:2-succinyl-5-enolpyruvyl-6-hydroxy-3- cyclohexene-1-carboxylic-acid synthase n=2 Tax=Stomatohabitans albus TaxID=3110766 RepID=UPI00300D96F3